MRNLVLVKNEHGMALVITLLVIVLLTAMVVEFSYGVYIGTNNLYNWRDAQRLSLMAKSGVNVTARMLKDIANATEYKTQNHIEMPVENPFKDFQGNIKISVEDETAKFNLNSLVREGGDRAVNMGAYNALKRLLSVLSLDERIADRIVDWIDENSEVKISGGEIGAKNTFLDSTDELLLMRGITKQDYDTLVPYITVCGSKGMLYVNINRAGIPVIRSVADSVKEQDAERIINHRNLSPFNGEPWQIVGQLQGIVNGFATESGVFLTAEGQYFSITSTATSGGVKRIIDMVLNTTKNRIEYWKEY
ncbi:MAG: type II secretion system minor pseudopilin GspK [Thermodesulfovibrionales bacterium]|nr:type II secretion system minor pseudopilin GspK [Thermodesulfovibrionales bacterium]